MRFEYWLTKLMQAFPTLFGDDVSRIVSVQWESWIPLWVFPFALAFLTVAAFWFYSREKQVSRVKQVFFGFIRMIVLFLIFFLIAAPRIVIEAEGAPPCVVPLLVDATGSMSIYDSDVDTEEVNKLGIDLNAMPDGRANRFDIAWAKAGALVLPADNEDAKGITLRKFTAGNQFRQISDEMKTAADLLAAGIVPDASVTSFSAMLRQGLNSVSTEPCHAMILISDGADNAATTMHAVLEELKQRKIKVHTVPVGGKTFRDASVQGIEVENILFANEKSRAVIRFAQNSCAGEKIRVRAYLEEHLFFETDFTLKAAADQNELPLEFTPAKAGVYSLKVEISSLAEDAIPDNNAYTRNFRVVADQIRVLLAFGTPSWEYRYLSGAFARDNRIKLSVWLGSVDERLYAQNNNTEAFPYLQKLPATAEELNKNYDVVILSGLDMTTAEPGFAEGLTKFVEEYGGGLVLSADPVYIPYTMRASALEDLVPVYIPRPVGRSYQDEIQNPKLEPLKFMVMPDGQNSEMLTFSSEPVENARIWREMPDIYSVCIGGRLKPSAITLLATFLNDRRQSYPALVLHSYGRGSVLFIGFDSTWRWRREFGNRYFRPFWGRVVQFIGLPHLLNEAEQSALLPESENCTAGEKLRIRARVFDRDFKPVVQENVTLTVKDQDGREHHILLEKTENRAGMYQGNFVPDSAGRLTLTLPEEFNALPVEVRVVKAGNEWLNPAGNDETLKQIAAATGGEFVENAEDLAGLMTAIVDGRKREVIDRTITLWDKWYLLALLLALLTLEWVYRKFYSLD